MILSLEAYCIQPDQAGDKICLFGFSRGAYTARALAGMLQKIGLLRESQFTQLDSAFAAYEKDDKDSLSKSAEFKMASIDVKVGFLGVWYVMRPLDQLPISYFHAGTLWNL